MAIPQSQYVAINSVVGGASQVPGREFIARVFTDNPLMPPQTYAEFPNLAAVGTYFGFTSQEYYRAAFYFSYVSKTGTAPTKISYARWVDQAVAPMVFGYIDATNQSLSLYHSISTGSLGITLNGVPHMFTALDFTGAADLAGVASILQSAISGVFAGSTVVYSAATANFILTAGTPAAVTVSIQSGTSGVDLVPLLNWNNPALIVNGQFFPQPGYATTTPGSLVETPVQSVITSDSLSTNFGSFDFMPFMAPAVLTGGSATVPFAATGNLYVGMAVEGVGIPAGTAIGVITTNTSFTLVSAVDLVTPVNATVSGTETLSFFLSLAQSEAIATWVKGKNVTYMYMLPVNVGNATTWQMGLMGIAGTGISLEAAQPLFPNEYPEMLPMAIFAATNYSYANSVVNYEFQQISGLTPSVSDLNSAIAYNNKSINYYGVTQVAGQLISFYQQGVLQGLATDPIDMNTYANEIWLKDAIGAAALNLLLTVNQVPANNAGRSMLMAVIQNVINQALFNGTISVGKKLQTSQIVYVGEITNDPNAWLQVQNQGYWIDIVFTPQATNPVTYAAVYTLVYSKDDTIRKVIGNDILI